jgi:hypothetical protein
MRIVDLWAVYNPKRNEIISVHMTKPLANGAKAALIYNGDITFHDAFAYRLSDALDRMKDTAVQHSKVNAYSSVAGLPWDDPDTYD